MLDAARQAAAAGMRAIVLKSHHELTAGHAQAIRNLVPGVEVLGGVTLNHSVGGLNPDAVEAAAALGARLVWMPTFTSAHHLRVHGAPAGEVARGITVLDDQGRLSAATQSVLDVVADRGLALATGHLAPRESALLATEARRRGIHAVLVNHPEMPFIDFPQDLQRELARLDGLYFERCYNAALGDHAAPGARPERPHDLTRIAAEIRTVGVASTVLSSDLGQPENPLPADGLRRYLAGLAELGFTTGDLDRMSRTNPAQVLRL
jgi:hypothetical protein